MGECASLARLESRAIAGVTRYCPASTLVATLFRPDTRRDRSDPPGCSRPLLAFALGALCVTTALIWLMLRLPRVRLPLDTPNERSLHCTPTPRIGGIAIMTATLGAIALQGPQWPLLLCTLALAALSYLDDRTGLPTWLRFGVHTAVAAAFIGAATIASSWWLAMVLVLAIVWMTNLFNFMDGSDGLAGGMALFGFGTYAIAAWLQHDATLAAICLCVAGAAAGFLLFNLHPARVFMGDSGSIPLGFLSAALGLLGWHAGHWPLWFPLVVFAPFVCDASITLMRRAARGERIWQAHKTHYYQRTVQLGWGHARTAWAEYALMIVVGLIALVAFRASVIVQTAALVVVGLIIVSIAAVIDRAWTQRPPPR